jgi:Rps23 Pro-64 3,4-dihydroxylase Tpa1-like proline 4-hydroxylase
MYLALNLAAANLEQIPFAHFSVANALDAVVAGEMLDWFEAAAPWQLVETDFYEQYEFSLYDADLPPTLVAFREPQFLTALVQNLTATFDAELDVEHVDITAHQLLPGQRIRVHNDFIPGRETHRLLIQLNRGWEEAKGGLLMLFAGPNVKSLRKLVKPIHRSAFGFAISAESHHAVGPVRDGHRYTLVYSFYAKGS